MKVLMTEYLRIDLDKEEWQCRVCDHTIGSARANYKEGLLVHDRDPADIHPSVIDKDNYEFTFSPDGKWVRILEYYCPSCGTQVEVEYTVPGHPPLYDMEVDLDALRAQWSTREEVTEPDLGPELVIERHEHGHGHGHKH
jgi:acetone carboxylase gamma subunit